jgi:hypothetical protein
MRAATLQSTGLEVVDVGHALDELDAMTPDELHTLDRRIWLTDFGVDIDERRAEPRRR